MNPDIEKARELFEKLHQQWEKLQRKLSVLLVEDNPSDVTLIKFALGAYPVEISVAPDGVDAIEKLRFSSYDLVLLDLRLESVLQGADVLRWIKNHGMEITVVALTGMSDESPMIKEALDLGAQCIIQKPLSPENVQMIFGALR